MTGEEFKNYWFADSFHIHKARPDLFTEVDVKSFHEFIDEVASSKDKVLMCPMVVASGGK